MKVLRTIAEVRAHLGAARRAGATIGLVPTMGAFHAGHEALIAAARTACDEVVVSLFVNPTQFGVAADLDAYPRTEASDVAAAEALGVDVLFAPAASEMYPDGFATRIRVAGLGSVLEGAARGPSHFDGVCTIVCKLFNIVAPDVAFFGQKDAQQVVVLRRMVRDLDLPVRMEIIPTVRADDGLALSSRNARLSARERERSVALRRALDAVRAAIDTGERDPAAAAAAGLAELHDVGLAPDYLTLVDPDTLEPVERVDGRTLVLVAAHVGPARLIDNDLIEQVATRA